ncbi:unnamed protein product [Amoebophrya sp. A120]|nr:unnamed protein product [Amoebophrya sp. A120]|eukprot:GSA120T00014071001.1
MAAFFAPVEHVDPAPAAHWKYRTYTELCIRSLETNGLRIHGLTDALMQEIAAALEQQQEVFYASVLQDQDVEQGQHEQQHENQLYPRVLSIAVSMRQLPTVHPDIKRRFGRFVLHLVDKIIDPMDFVRVENDLEIQNLITRKGKIETVKNGKNKMDKIESEFPEDLNPVLKLKRLESVYFALIAATMLLPKLRNDKKKVDCEMELNNNLVIGKTSDNNHAAGAQLTANGASSRSPSTRSASASPSKNTRTALSPSPTKTPRELLTMDQEDCLPGQASPFRKPQKKKASLLYSAGGTGRGTGPRAAAAGNNNSNNVNLNHAELQVKDIRAGKPVPLFYHDPEADQYRLDYNRTAGSSTSPVDRTAARAGIQRRSSGRGYFQRNHQNNHNPSIQQFYEDDSCNNPPVHDFYTTEVDARTAARRPCGNGGRTGGGTTSRKSWKMNMPGRSRTMGRSCSTTSAKSFTFPSSTTRAVDNRNGRKMFLHSYATNISTCRGQYKKPHNRSIYDADAEDDELLVTFGQ